MNTHLTALVLLATVACRDGSSELQKTGLAQPEGAPSESTSNETTESEPVAPPRPTPETGSPPSRLPPSLQAEASDEAVPCKISHKESLGLFSSVRISPSRDGANPGLVLTTLTPDEPLHIIGLRGGDTIVRINSIVPSTPNNMIAAYAAIRESGTVTVDFTRLGRPLRRSCKVNLDKEP